ncbi:pseudouridylate synthase 7 homolog-like protein isoform X1 [Neopelma chrysocephalum]|uniref:pseudouridylate synthase 7 homolog-like protein isoform X1 n=2 Tax=Neopelma chrysocephalum TaxID=114329 RepID=UPI000FCD18C6|nr:pseudouridylate synthase 7 homolog-like protein isoform X1 [Neopelma chrysocephalum]
MLPSFSYLTEHTGFRGTIKNSPADFVVTEIEVPERFLGDSGAELPQKTSEALAEQSAPCPRQPKQRRAEAPGPGAPLCPRGAAPGTPERDPGRAGGGCAASSGKKQREGAPEPKSGLEETKLESLLGKPMSELLNKFACDLKEAWGLENSPSAGTRELSLGARLDKKSRADLHSAVRQKFPFLVTVTKDNEMIVKGNADYKELCQLVTEKETSDFFKFLDAKLENSTFSFEPDGNKEHRKVVHHFLHRKFGKLLETKSFTVTDVNDQPNMSIIVRFREKCGSRKRSAGGSQEKQDVYTAFTLQKENVETLEAIGLLAAELDVLPSDFSYTGIKDKKAITFQPMVVKKVTPERLKEIGNKMEKKGMRIYNIRSTYQHLRLGQLKGNHFDIVVRDLQKHSHDSSADLKKRISEAMENVETKGFVNYYGPQRFGQGQIVQTDQIGLALLSEKMVEAMKLFFTPEDTDDPVNNAKRYFLQTEDAKGTLVMLPEFKVREKMLLRALNRYGVNHEGCTKGWLNIPHSLRIFYVHAYCSKIWNEAASYRLKIYGLKVVEGDLVLSEENDESISLNNKVHVVTASEESARKYSIYQVVLPMVGHSIKYPSNKVGEWYHERLSKDELEMCKFRVSPLQLNIPGCYRLILKNVQNLSYFLEGGEKGIKIEDNHLNDLKVSLHISFDLDPSCYATVCLREIMKCDF